MDTELLHSPLYEIKPSGWGRCSVCERELKGLNDAATHRVMEQHLFHAHGIKLAERVEDAQGDEGRPFEAPTFVPDRRNGSGILRSLDTHYGKWV